MEHFPSVLSFTESAALVERIESCFERRGYGLWAVEAPREAAFVGCVGLWPVELQVPFAPAVEVRWRLARAYWDRATRRRRHGPRSPSGSTSFTSIRSSRSPRKGNVRSRRVMGRLGMRRDPADDFEHPLLPLGSRLSQHVLYRLSSRTDAVCAL